MKTCDEMVNSLFQRREEYLAQQKIKRRNAVISTVLYCCAFAAVFGIGVWIKGEISRKPIPVDSSTTNAGSTSVIISECLSHIPIKWAAKPGNYGDLVDDMDGIIEWNGKQISGRLWGALDEGGEDCLYAVEARYFPVDEQFVYNGKTLAQYEAEHNEKSGKLETGFIIERLLEAADSMEIENGDIISKDIYDKLVSYIEERISKPDIEEKISEYIADGVFLKDKAVQYTTKAEEEWKAAVQAENQAEKAFRAHFYKEVGKQLEAKGIRNEFIYEDTNPEDFLNSGFVSDYLLLYISKEDFANLALDNMSDWIFCHAYNDTEVPIVWAEEPKIKGDTVSSLDYFVKWNGKDIHNRLLTALEENKNDDNCLFAVNVRYSPIDYQYVYNGKTLAQYEEEAQGIKLDHLFLLLKESDNLKYKVLLKLERPDKEKLAKELYDNTVSVIGEELLSQYIVDGVFLKDKVLQDIPKAEKEAQEIKIQHLHLLLKEAEDLEYKEILNHLETLEKEKWTKELYDNTVSVIGEELLSQYIVDGVFLKEKVLEDIPKAEKEAEAARQAFNQGCAAYRVHVYEETLEQLEAQGVEYELSKDSANLLLFISKEDFANFTLDNISDWTFFHASKSEGNGSDTAINE